MPLGAGGGDGVSACKARLAQKLGKQGVAAPAQLIAELWKLNPEATKEIKGTPQEVEKQIHELATACHLCLSEGRWVTTSEGELRDAVWDNDPWSHKVLPDNEHASCSTQQDRCDHMEIKSIFADELGNPLPRKSLSDLAVAQAGPAVTCVHKSNFPYACDLARRRRDPVVLLLREELPHIPDDATHTRMQLVTRGHALAQWKATQWSCVTFGDAPVEVTLEGIELALPEGGAVQMIAELREDHIEAAEFQKFLRMNSLEGIGLQKNVFPVHASRQWGKPPYRVAVKKATVAEQNVKFAMHHSGIGQISIKCESISEERCMNIATHSMNCVDAEEVRRQIAGINHLGVVRIRGEKCLARCEPKDILELRKALCPHDPRFGWCISEVPLQVSALRISQALSHNLSWMQLPLGIARRFPRRGVHEVIVGSADPPPTDTLMVDGSVCLIRPHRQPREPLDAQPRIVPAEAINEHKESSSSAANVVDKKVQMELRIAGEAMKGMAEQQVANSAVDIESRVTEALHKRMGDFERRMSSVEAIADKVNDISENLAEVTHIAQAVQADHAALEPRIDSKIAEAVGESTRQLTTHLEGKFDSFGQQLLQQIASMARKRDASDSSDTDMHGKQPRGQGAGKLRKRKHSSHGASQQVQKKPCNDTTQGAVTDTDLDESQLEEKICQVTLTSWPKGRRLWQMYRPERSTVREMYWEFGRVAKRGIGKFAFHDDTGALLELSTLIGDLNPKTVYRVVAEDWKWEETLRLQGIDVEDCLPRNSASSSTHPPAHLVLPDASAHEMPRLERDELWQRIIALESQVEELRSLLREHGIARGSTDQPPDLGFGGMSPGRGPSVDSSSGSGKKVDSHRVSGQQGHPLDWGFQIARLLGNMRDVSSLSSEPGTASEKCQSEAPELDEGVRSGVESQRKEDGDTRDLRNNTAVLSCDVSGSSEANSALRNEVSQDLKKEVLNDPGLTLRREERGCSLPVPREESGASRKTGDGNPENMPQLEQLELPDGEIPLIKKEPQQALETFCVESKGQFHVFSLCANGQRLPAGPVLGQYGAIAPARRLPGWSVSCLRCGSTIEARRWKQVRQNCCRQIANNSSKKEGPPKPHMLGGSKRTHRDQSWLEVDRACEFLRGIEASADQNLDAKQRKIILLMHQSCNSILKKHGTAAEKTPPDDRSRVGAGGRIMRIATINAGSVRGKVKGMEHLGSLVAIQETIASSSLTRGINGEASLYGKRFHEGCPASVVKDSLGRWQCRKGRGLGVLVNQSDSWHGLARAYDSRDLADGRLHSGWWSTDGLILSYITCMLSLVAHMSGVTRINN